MLAVAGQEGLVVKLQEQAPSFQTAGPRPNLFDRREVRALQWVAVAAILFLIFVRILFPTPAPILLLGATLGSLSALIAMGIVLVYRANRIVNFAAGDLGALASVLAVSLIVGPGWPYFPALLVGLVAALVLGATVEFLVIRRFAKAPRLILSVATIGLGSVLAFGQVALPRAFGYETAPQNFPVPFDVELEWFPYVFRTSHVLVMIVVPLVAAGLAAFFRFSRIGIAVRASAESADRASLLGVPVKRIGTLVWVLASGLSGIAVLLRAPIVGVQIGSVLGPSLLLRALAAAVIARMENLPVAFGVSLLLGMAEQAVFWDTGRTILADPVLFAVIMGGLLFQRRRTASRAEDAQTSSWRATREVRPIPRELAGLPEVKWTVRGLGLAAAAALVIVPLTWNGSRVNLFGIGLIFGMIGVSLVILTGWAGQISLGQLTFVGFGAAVAGKMAEHGWHLFACLVAAGIVGALVAVTIGIPALRIRGPFLAVATLGFAIAANSFFLNAEFFPWLVPAPSARIDRPTLFGKFDLESEHAYFYVILIVLLAVIVSARSLRRSRTGRVLIATRDNQRAAQSYGVSPTNARLVAFAVSGFIAALAGGLYVFHQHTLSNTILKPEENIRVFAMVVIGGPASIPGGLLGAAYETFLRFSPFTRLPLARLLGSGLGVLLILLVLPAGLGGLAYDVRDSLLRVVARRRKIIVPSLVADVRVETDPLAVPDGRRPAVGEASDSPVVDGPDPREAGDGFHRHHDGRDPPRAGARRRPSPRRRA